jgi:hypothetical protein
MYSLLHDFADSVPPELVVLRQWVFWRYVYPDSKPSKPQNKEPKPDKRPVTAMGYAASTTNPEHHSYLDHLLRILRQRPAFADGVGFVFTRDDAFCGIDLDNIWLSDAAEIAPWASLILERFRDTYSEASPSDTGVKIWCRAHAPRCGRWPVENGAIEVYDWGRFFAVTSRAAQATPRVITDHQHDIELLVARLDDNGNNSPTNPIPARIPEGTRHRSLVSLAGTMWRRNMCPEAIEAALLIVNERQCDPPHSPEHIRTKIMPSVQKWPR